MRCGIPCGVPVISSDAGGIPEVNIDGETGFVSKVGDVDKMAQDSLRLLKDEDLLTRFRENALQKASHFTLDNIVPEYEKLYSDTIGKLA